MKLQFISQGSPGISKSERRKIRSHVMKGKNAGRPRPSTRKQTGPVHIRRTLACRGVPGTGYTRPQSLLWSDLSLTSFPQQLDPESTKLMHRWFFDISDALFPPRFCSKFDILKSIWVDCILSDAAYFHSTLAISASYVDYFERKPRMSMVSLYHISQAYSLVNRKLSGPEPIADDAIAAVVSLIIYQQIHSQYSIGLIHLNGLYRMVELRGGIGKLVQENRGLALKPLRLDLELTLRTGLPSMFHSVDRGRSRIFASKTSAAMLETINFAKLLNSLGEDEKSKLDALEYTQTLLSLLYRLIDFSQYTTWMHHEGDRYDNLTYLALLAFMTSLLPEYGQDCTTYPLLSNRLDGAIDDFHAMNADLQRLELSLLLWALFVSGVSAPAGKDRPWLSRLIFETCKRLGIYDWSAVRDRLCQYPWIYTLHDYPGQCMWEQAQTENGLFDLT
ncbi:hypothetical protein GQ53DRAFT_779328 [Thozetella sp. PMI_491]|nr:hypothetical protein GQ53DRAFT_779328 [Thozetella sp. PMI_491]